MATPSKIQLSPSEKPEFWTKAMNDKSAAKTSSLLQENHEIHHVFFNDEGFHNHIVHQLLTLYALGASPETITKHYELNKSYQRPAEKLEEEVVQEMHDPAKFKECLGKEEFYHDFVVFFQKEMESKGWEAVVNEYLFKGDERAEDMLVRTFSGPYIKADPAIFFVKSQLTS
jgi:Questin oxidase-like